MIPMQTFFELAFFSGLEDPTAGIATGFRRLHLLVRLSFAFLLLS